MASVMLSQTAYLSSTFFLILPPTVCPACMCVSVLESLLSPLFPNVFVSGVDSEMEISSSGCPVLWLLLALALPSLSGMPPPPLRCPLLKRSPFFRACLLLQTFPQALESHVGVPLPSWLPAVFQCWSPSILPPWEDAHLRPGLVLFLGGKFI